MRPPPGEQVSAGRIRVDAARAIAKLREFQLADRAAWALEVVRAAIASGATQIDVAGDTDDVWIAWRGTPLAAEDLPRLFDELVSPEATAERYHVRLLAAGINSALGMQPWFADVYAVPGGRVRYTPDSYEGDGLRGLAVEPDAVPPRDGVHLDGDGMMVHVHKRMSFALATRLFSRTKSAEALAIASACRNIGVPLTVDGVAYGRDRHDGDLVRVPLGDGLGGWLAITDTRFALRYRSSEWAGRLELAEHGVDLDLMPLAILDGEPQNHLPIRVYVDEPRLPTNASRSHVRDDIHPVTTARRRARDLLPRAIAELLALVQSGDAALAARARHAAIVMLAATLPSSAGILGLAAVLPPAPFDALATAPLLRDGTGTPRPATHAWTCVYTHAKPVDGDLARWVGSVLWEPDELLARTLLGGGMIDHVAATQFLRSAKRMAKLHAKFFAHAQVEPTVIARRPPRARYALGPIGDRFTSAVDDTTFAELRGEVCVYAEPHPRKRPSEIVLLWQGRELDRILVESRIAFDAVIDAADLVPGERFRSAVHDAAYECAIAAANGGLYRAIELIARDERPDDAPIIREGLRFGLTLGLGMLGPLVDAPAWPCTDGTARSTVALREARVIGAAPDGSRMLRPVGRPVVCGNRGPDLELLARLCPSTMIVQYTFDGEATTIERLAKLPGTACALAIDVPAPPGTLAVITPSATPRVSFMHRGVELVRDDYTPKLMPCAIVIDSDALVPNDDWNGLRDDAGLRVLDFGAWELALVRAMWAAIAGRRPENLRGDPIDFGTPIADLACHALATKRYQIALEKDLVEALKDLPVIEVLGDPVPCSLAELVGSGKFGTKYLPYVPPDTEPVAGVFAIVAPAMRARALAALLELDVFDLTATVERERVNAARRMALAIHRSKQPQPIVLPPTKIAVPIASGLVKGEVALGEEGLDIRVLCEGRELCRIRENGWPVVAVVDIAEAEVDDAFTAPSRKALNAIRFEIAEGALALLRAIGERAPAQLVDEAFPLLALWCAGDGALDKELRVALCEVPAFATIQGERVSLFDAARAHGTLELATWEQPWLAPGDGEPASACDQPILKTGTRALNLVIGRLFGNAHAIVDVTEDAKRLQHQRRIARGLVPTPALASAPAKLKCKLAELGPGAIAALGHGEIALSLDDKSFAQIYANGEVIQTIPLTNVYPRADVAFESAGARAAKPLDGAGIAELEASVQKLATSLLWKLLPGLEPVPPALRRGMFAALIVGAIDRVERADLEVAQLASGAFVPFARVVDQIAKYGNAWAVTTHDAAERARPLSDQRLVFRTTHDVLELANKHDLALIDATEELTLDARAHANRALPKRRFAITSPTLASVELPGNGITESKILVGLLDPVHAANTMVWATRDGSPFQPRPLACTWPTVAHVEDPRFVPDRTWDHAVMDATWERAIRRIEKASAKLHAELGGEAPATALVSRALDGELLASCGLPKDKTFVIAGLTWLDRDPIKFVPISVIGAPWLGGFTPAAPVRARLFPYGRAGGALHEIVERVGAAAHSALLRALIKSGADAHDDAIAAHLAIGLAHGRIGYTEPNLAAFPCFVPDPLSPGQFAGLMKSKQPVHVYREADRGLGRGLVDDGSQLARAIKQLLGDRAVFVPAGGFPKLPVPPIGRVAPPLPGLPPERAQELRLPPIVETQPTTAPPKPRRKERPIHPMSPVADALQRRLGELSIMPSQVLVNVDHGAPLLSVTDTLLLGADDPRARAILRLKTEGDPSYDDALDLLAAHAAAVLDAELTSVTASNQAAAICRLIDDA